mgnify:CR=1 FL=1
MKKVTKKNEKKISKKKNQVDELQKIKEKLIETEEKNLRLLADYENLKKRKNEEIVRLLKYSGEDLIKQLIPIFEDLDRIIKESKKDKSNDVLYKGIEILSKKLYKTLSNNCIERFDSIGQMFDTNLHDALMIKDSKKKKNIIIEEFEKGYKYHDRIIKHSKVIVSKGK